MYHKRQSLDKGTPLVIENFCINETVSLILLNSWGYGRNETIQFHIVKELHLACFVIKHRLHLGCYRISMTI